MGTDLTSGNDQLCALGQVQARVRHLVVQYAGLHDALRSAFDAFVTLVASFEERQARNRSSIRQRVQRVLKSGKLIDPKFKPGRPHVVFPIEGLCEVKLADELLMYGPGDTMAAATERAAAKSALAALDGDPRYQSPELSSGNTLRTSTQDRGRVASGSHKVRRLYVVLAQPADWEEPPDPRSSDLNQLRRFKERDFRIIVLYRLGGLADAGSVRPIVPQPSRSEKRRNHRTALAAWYLRQPFTSYDGAERLPKLCRLAFPPTLAEEMVGHLERWIADRKIPSVSSVARGVLAQSKPGIPHIALTKDHESILAILGKQPTKCLAVHWVASLGPIRNRETVGKLLRDLERLQLVHRPYGPRRGYTLTQQGLQLIANGRAADIKPAQVPT